MATNGGSFQIPSSVIDFQRRILEFQRSMFTNALDMTERVQEQRHDVLERWIDRVPNLPEESKALYETWSGAARRSRETFRATIDKSFDLVEDYYERLASKGQPAESASPAAEGAA